jgi:cytochrome c oxidase subunit 2
VGPTFTGLIGRSETVVRGGKEVTVNVDEGYVRRYIRNPNVDVVKGYQAIMPHISLTDVELDAIVTWLATLKTGTPEETR